MPPRRIRRPCWSTSLNSAAPLRRPNRSRRPVEHAEDDPGDTVEAVLGAVVIRASSPCLGRYRKMSRWPDGSQRSPGSTHPGPTHPHLFQHLSTDLRGRCANPYRAMPKECVTRAVPPAAHSRRGGWPTCSGGKPVAALLAPSIQNGATLARSDAMSEPVLALSAAVVRLVGALHSGSLIGQPGYGARCVVTACPARAGACRHFLEVPQDYGQSVRFAKMSGLRRPTGTAGHAACPSRCKSAKLFGRERQKLWRVISPRSPVHPLTRVTRSYAR